MTTTTKEHISPTEFGALVGRHPDTIMRWIREGRIRNVIRLPGGRVRIDRSEVDKLVDAK